MRIKAKSSQCIAYKNNVGINLPIHTFHKAMRINLPKDFENIEVENENIATLEMDNSMQNFERMEMLEAYFPHFNYEN